MPKDKPAAPQTVTWIPTRADSIVKDEDGNILSINGEPVYAPATPNSPAPFDRDVPASAGQALGTK